MKKNISSSKKYGAVTLIVVYFIAAVLLVLFIALGSKTLSNKLFTSRNIERSQTLHIAEAGLDYALSNLKTDYNWTPSANPVSFANGEFLLSIETIGGKKLVLSQGFLPTMVDYRQKRTLEAWVQESIPLNFYDNAIYSAGEVDINGNAYEVNGDIVYYSNIDNTGNVNGTITQDDTVNPLAMLDFEDLYTRSALQGNVYDAQRLDDVKNGTDSFPTSFWETPPADPTQPETGIPNFVYVEGDLVLNGNINIGGFYIVVGDVLNNPSAAYDSTVNGVGQIDGCIYTRGEFRINGGAGGLNVNGGVWAGTEARLNGNARIDYNADYMAALRANIHSDAQIISWREILP